MLTIDLARRLTEAGLVWQPSSGDRFVVPVSGMEEDVFVISEITVDVHHFTTGDVIGFNGTTEWALDSVALDQTLWLPREDQLRELLGDRLRCVRREPEGWLVESEDAAGEPVNTFDADLECAYARALLRVA